MLYRIQIEQRFNKQKAVIEAVKELASDFVILTGMAYFGNNYRPCQIIEINSSFHIGTAVKVCVDKLKKILNTSHILVTRSEIQWVVH
ncbi:hypothetical protein LCGC14_0437410 [marine sediment metagenome]|uniref:Uncharacterized protein n=1 Tax=marine sediment metagenome TaxID=412755 RepID=A0A0F9SLE6_9ZZZZ